MVHGLHDQHRPHFYALGGRNNITSHITNTTPVLSEGLPLQELIRILDFHSVETIVLQHFYIPSKYKDKVYCL